MTDTLPDFDTMGRAEPVTDPLADPDPGAPYGRAEDGVLIDKRGKRAPLGLTKSGLRRQGGKKNRGLPHTPSPSARASASRPSGRTITRKRRDGLIGLTDLPKGVCIGVGLKADNTAMLAEAATIDMHAPGIAAALADIAEDNDRLGAVIDRLIDVGPMATLGIALGAFLAQTARNFGAMPAPVAAMLGGGAEPDDLADMVRRTVTMTDERADNGTEPAAA